MLEIHKIKPCKENEIKKKNNESLNILRPAQSPKSRLVNADRALACWLNC